MADAVALATLVESVASFLQTWSGRAIAFVAGLGIVGFLVRKFLRRVFDTVMSELVRRTEGISYLHAFLEWVHPQTLEEVRKSQDEMGDAVEDIREEVVTTPVELLEDQGLERLTEETFDPGKRDPEACWRRPFEFAEIRADFAIDRQRTDDERTDVTEDLLGRLRGEDGHSQIVVGPPGSGKTTVCKTVATEWYESKETGSVFYRESGTTHTVTDPSDVVAGVDGLTDDEDRVLVVVEDAVQASTIRIHKAIDDCPSYLDVSFLLDAREDEWNDFDETVRTHLDLGTAWNRILENRTQNVQRYQMPILDAEEVGRVVTKFANVTGRSDERLPSPEVLHQHIRGDVEFENGRSVGPSAMLLLTYHLPIGDVDLSEWDENKSALRRRVEGVFSKVINWEGDKENRGGTELLKNVALLVNVLNAADIGVHEELIQTLADDDQERRRIEHYLREELAGLLTYGKRGSHQYWSNHKLWSEVYLDYFFERVGEDTARNRFGTVVSKLLTIVDGEEENLGLWKWYQGNTELLQEITDRPTKKADEYVSAVFGIAVQRPKLAPMLGRTDDYDPIEVPSACSRGVRVDRAIRRGQSYLEHGDGQEARQEFESALRVADESGINEKGTDATILNNLGIVAESQSEYATARDHIQRALDIFEDIGDSVGEATAVGNLGIVARNLGDYDVARDYYERSLDIKRDIGDRAGEADALNNLGNVARNQGDYDAARDYYECSLDIKRDVGDRAGAAETLVGLGITAANQGDYAAARDYFQYAIDVFQDVGDRAGEADALLGLGNVTLEQNDPATASEYYRRALDHFEDIGDCIGEANALGNLGTISLEEANFETAQDYYERSLEIKRDIDNRAGEADTLNNLGEVARNQNDHAAARDYFQRSLEVFEDVGDRAGMAFAISNLGANAGDQEDYDQARKHFEDAAAIFHDIGAIRRLLVTYRNLAKTCKQQGDLSSAIEWCKIGLSTIDDVDIKDVKYEHETLESLLAHFQELQLPVQELYADGLAQTPDDEMEDATEPLYTVWEQRNGVDEDSDTFSLILAAGVGFAAHTRFFDDEQADADRQEVLEEIAQHEDRLAQPELALYEYLTEGETDTTTEELWNEVDEDSEKPDLGDLEYIAYAGLLEALQEQDEEQ